jgi:hypothetical protein
VPFSSLWALVPVQLAVNRLHTMEGRRLRLTTDGWELAWVHGACSLVCYEQVTQGSGKFEQRPCPAPLVAKE